MKVFACFEGDSDIGALETFLKKCAKGISLDIESYTHTTLRETKRARLLNAKAKNIPKDDSKFTRESAIRKLLYLADKNNESHIAYHQDTGDDGFRKTYNKTKKAFVKAGVPDEIKSLAIVPKKMIESWLLADVKAINLLGDGTSHVDQSPNPETLRGNEQDPNSNYPKNYLKRNLEQLGLNLDNKRDTYAKIAENTDVEILKRRCPESFGQFYTDMQSFIPTETAPMKKKLIEAVPTLEAINFQAAREKSICHGHPAIKKHLPKSMAAKKAGMLSPQLSARAYPVIEFLSYSHLELLTRIEDETKRLFYEVECIRGSWSVRELERQP
jgi:hypothetical protein